MSANGILRGIAMTASNPEVQWYIARDGKQYGPVSDAEMQKLVELRHLKPGDLLWRPGFPEWRQATSVFPPQPPPMQPKLSTQAPASTPQSQPQAQPQPQAQRPQPQPQANPQPQRNEASPAGWPEPAGLRRGDTAAQADQVRRTQPMGDPSQTPTGRSVASGQHGPQIQPGGTRAPDGDRAGMHPQSSTGQMAAGAGSPSQSATGAQRGPRAGMPQTGGAAGEIITPGRSGALTPVAHGDAEEESSSPRRSRSRTLAIAMAVLLIAAGAGYLLSNGGSSNLSALLSSVTKPGGDGKAAPLEKLTDTTEALDAHFQRTAMWVVVKREFPDWYGERVKEAAKLSSEKASEDKIAKHLVEALVSLRRKHADVALAAGMPKLKMVATAFLGNLKALASKSTDACYSFISQGETSPAVIEMMRSSDQNAAIQAQVAAIFEAIAEGRKSPTQHSAPVKTDYDALADQLTKLGWSQTDLQLFADSRALSKAPPAKVCSMVQDWFTAHIQIPDAEVQERLLVETLRPVVAG